MLEEANYSVNKQQRCLGVTENKYYGALLPHNKVCVIFLFSSKEFHQKKIIK